MNERQEKRWVRRLILLTAVGMAAAIMTAAVHAAPCEWDKPGANPFTGDRVAAIDHYTHIPQAVREQLKAKARARAYDDVATIRRDTIEGKGGVYGALTHMHFGKGRVCEQVSRSKWLPTHQERALVYVAGGYAVAAPTVCGNVALLGLPVAPAPALPTTAQADLLPSITAPTMPLPEVPVAPTAPALPGSFEQVAQADGLSDWGLGLLALLGLLVGSGGHMGGSGTVFPPPTHVPGIPEPAAAALWSMGLAAVWYLSRKGGKK